jgi:hypothetical protein
MIINYWYKYTDFLLLSRKKMLKIIHIFHQEMNTKLMSGISGLRYNYKLYVNPSMRRNPCVG